MIHNLKHKILLLIALLPLLVSCEQGFMGEWWGGETPAEGNASLTLTVAVPPADETTRAVAAAGTAAAGEKMNTLLVLLVRNSDNIIVARQEVVDDATGFRNSNTEAVVTFDNLAVATYRVYLIANYESVSTVTWANYAVNANISSIENALVGALSGVTTPSYAENKGMPMTAKLTTTLQHGTNTVDAEMERVVARFGVSLHNHVDREDFKVVFSDVKLSNFNAPNTYLFNHSNEVPSGSYRAFFESSSESVYAPAGTSTTFDTYLYETDSSASYELSLAVAIFKATDCDPNTPPKVTTTKGPEATNHNTIENSSAEYFLFNSEHNAYFYINSSGGLALSATVPSATDPLSLYNNYKWRFSATNTGTIYNVGRGVYLQRSGYSLTTSNSGTVFTFGTNENKFYMRYGYDTKYFISATSNTTVGLTMRDSSTSTNTPDKDTQRWYLRKETTTTAWNVTPQATAVITDQALTYDDAGYVKPLTQIKRNQNIQVGVNLFYNPSDGYFNFEVVEWTEKEVGNVTFD